MKLHQSVTDTILAQAKRPLKDAAAVNIIRCALFQHTESDRLAVRVTGSFSINHPEGKVDRISH